MLEKICLPAIGGIFALNNNSDVKFNGSVSVNANAYIYNGAVMTLTGNTTVTGKIYYDDLSMVELKGATATTQPMTPTEYMQRSVALELAAAAESAMPTQPLDPMDPMAMDLTQSAVYAAQSTVPVNVISARNVLLGSGQTLSLVGTANSIFLIKISGQASFGDGIILEGVPVGHVLIYLTSEHSNQAITVGGKSGIKGTFLSLDRQISFSGQGSFNGAIISGSTVSPAIGVGGSSGGSVAQFTGDAFCTVKAY